MTLLGLGMELPESETDSTEGILILSTPEPTESSQIPEKLQYTDSAHSLVYSVTPWQYVDAIAALQSLNESNQKVAGGAAAGAAAASVAAAVSAAGAAAATVATGLSAAAATAVAKVAGVPPATLKPYSKNAEQHTCHLYQQEELQQYEQKQHLKGPTAAVGLEELMRS